MTGNGWRHNTKGAIEGLPLYLLIIIIIAAVSIGIVMGLLNMAKPPQTLGTVGLSTPLVAVQDLNGDGISENGSFSLTVTVCDGTGNRLAGAVVSLNGDDVKKADGTNPYAITDPSGQARFTGLSCAIVGSGTNPITVTIEKSGYGHKTLDIPVVQQ